MKTKFSKTDLGCVIGDDWDIFGNRVRREKDGLHLVENGEHDSCWFHPEPENPVLPFPFTLEQFRAFCDWHPTFQWEAIESVFTNDDGSLDDAAIGSLNPASAADLVRAVLATHDAEFQLAWRIHEQLDQCKAKIQRWERLEQNAPTPSEAIIAEHELAGLRAELAGLLSQLSGVGQEQAQSVQATESERPDYSMLADPDELIEAFGRFTGMSKAWFSNITDKPGLEQARRFKGSKGKGGHKPLFCPLAVMLWLTTSSRKVGTSLSEEKGWALLESYFPRVYAAHAAAKP